MKLEIEEKWLKHLLKAELTLHILKQVYEDDEMFKAVLELDDMEDSAHSIVEILKRDQKRSNCQKTTRS